MTTEGEKWSLSMIVKDGAEHLAQTLECATQFCDELIIVDTGSTDNTVEIAESFGSKVFHFEWIDDFSAARNEALRYCTGEWIIWLDCGDVIPPQAIEGFKTIKTWLAENGEPFDFVWLNINRGIADNGAVLFRFNTPRLMRNRPELRWIGAVHEYLEGSNERAMIGQGAWVDDPLALNNQPTDRNIKILKRLLDNGDTTTRTAYYYANELRDHKRWNEAIEAYNHFLSMNYYSWEYYDALISLATAYKSENRIDEMVDAYFRAIKFDPTRAEAYVGLGDFSYERQQWQHAIPFYLAARGAVRPIEGFVLETCYTWLPIDRLAVCYGNLGRLEEAIKLTVEALKQCPEQDRLLDNLRMFTEAVLKTANPT